MKQVFPENRSLLAFPYKIKKSKEMKRLSKLTSKHQVTIPKAVRKELDLHAGEQVTFKSDSSGRVYLQKNRTTVDSEGCGRKFLNPEIGPISVEGMQAAIEDHFRGA